MHLADAFTEAYCIHLKKKNRLCFLELIISEFKLIISELRDNFSWKNVFAVFF